MKPQSAIAKGKELENWIVDRIIALGLDSKACRSAGSGNGNREKSDINTSLTILGKNIGIEAKNHKTLHIQEWWRQTEKLEVLGREPVLAFKIARDPFEATNVVIRLETLLELVKWANKAYADVAIIKEDFGKSAEDQRNMKWALENVKSGISKLLKYL